MNALRLVHSQNASLAALTLEPDQDASAAELAGAQVIALRFPKFTDGRAYSQAATLRKTLGFTGRLQAVGDVLVDQAQFMVRAGFDELVLREDQSIEVAQQLLQLPTLRYQSSIEEAPLTLTPAPKPQRLTRPSSDYAGKLLAAQAALDEALRLDGPVTLACSLGAEDMVLLHLANESARQGFSVFVLDTQRLHAQTLELLALAKQRYTKLSFEVLQPDERAVRVYESTHGRDAFYESTELRKTCCALRKTEPLARALQGKAAWITGLRSAQSATRAQVSTRQWDASHGLEKFSPLADWTEGDIWHFIDEHQVPYNPLHDEFFPSIGCAPCTRAITPGEDIRAGRWWWEDSNQRECGLHVHTESPA